jgi:hypothetical protein
MDQYQVRRLVHLCAPLFCVYYLLPDPVLPGLGRAEGVLFVMLFTLGFEAMRLIFRIKVPGMRSYEFDRPSAAAYTAVGLTVALLCFPIELTLPTLMCMGWVDPLVGELRRNGSKMNPTLPLTAYFLIMLLGLMYFHGFTFPVMISAALITPIAIFLESRRFRFLDDDMVLIMVPLLLLGLTFGKLPF